MSTLSKKLDEMKKHINEQIQKVVKETVFNMHTQLLESRASGGTPVITGFLRDNWFVSLGSPDPSVAGSQENTGPAKSKQNSKMDAFILSDIFLYDSIYINNSVYYGEDINYRAGYGFRKLAIQVGDITLKQAKVIK